MQIIDCIACQYGQHDMHHEVIEQPPSGVMGGSMCPCKGECVERKSPNAIMSVSNADVTSDDLSRQASARRA